MKWWKNEIIL